MAGRFVRRDRPRRVHIDYPGPTQSDQRVELPFVIGVMGDLSGDTSGREKPELLNRFFFDVNGENVDACMAALEPGLTMTIDRQGQVTIQLTFRSLRDFEPEAVASRLPELTGLFASRHEEKYLDAILDTPAFQALESRWRGLRYLVDSVAAGSAVKIRAFDVSKAELARLARRYPGDLWNQSPMFKRVGEDIFGVLGAAPFSCLVGDFTFSHTAEEIEILRSLARIADGVHAPLLAGADPRLLGVDRWSDLDRADLATVFEGPDYTAWNRLRDEEICRFVGPCGPRLLARPPFDDGGGLLWMECRLCAGGECRQGLHNLRVARALRRR